jgi:glycosyltransferase involved in cell wall biosynthesis
MDFNIVGSGDKNIEAVICEYASKLSNVNYLGPVNYNEKWQVYQRNDILLHPSYMDTFPSAILEALSYGLPVITTCEIDSPISNGGEGFLFQAGNLDQIIEKLNALRANPVLYHKMSKAALQTAKKYTWDNAAKQFLKLYLQ